MYPNQSGAIFSGPSCRGVWLPSKSGQITMIPKPEGHFERDSQTKPPFGVTICYNLVRSKFQVSHPYVVLPSDPLIVSPHEHHPGRSEHQLHSVPMPPCWWRIGVAHPPGKTAWFVLSIGSSFWVEWLKVTLWWYNFTPQKQMLNVLDVRIRLYSIV